MIAVRQYSSAQEMMANAAAIRARLMNAKPKPKPLSIAMQQAAAPESKTKAKQKRKPVKLEEIPEWQRRETFFDAHVLDSRHILAMIEAGEIEISGVTKRTILSIVTDVLKSYPGISVAQLRGPSRTKKLIKPRHQAMWTVHQELALSYPVIGRWFGGRDHTSIMHAVRKIEAERAMAPPPMERTSHE